VVATWGKLGFVVFFLKNQSSSYFRKGRKTKDRAPWSGGTRGARFQAQRKQQSILEWIGIYMIGGHGARG